MPRSEVQQVHQALYNMKRAAGRGTVDALVWKTVDEIADNHDGFIVQQLVHEIDGLGEVLALEVLASIGRLLLDEPAAAEN